MRNTAVTMRPELVRACEALRSEGFAVLENALSPKVTAGLQESLSARFAGTPKCEGDFHGRHTKRFGGLLKRSEFARELVMHVDVMALANAVLGASCDRVQLNVTEATEVGSGEIAQVPYRDSALWPMVTGCGELAISVVWPLTDDARASTRVWPGSHAGATEFPDTPVVPLVAPGCALLLLGSVLRGAAANASKTAPRTVTIGYCLGWLKPYENQWLTYPPEVARHFDPALAELVGYRRDRPNLGGVDGACPTWLLGEVQPEFVTAQDALSANQSVALAAFREIQSAVESNPSHAL